VVLLAPAPAGFSNARPIEFASLGDGVAEHIGDGGRHLIIPRRDGELRLSVLARHQQPLAVVIPIDADFPARAAAASRFWAQMHGRLPAAARALSGFTVQRRDRLILMVRALDGHLAAAPYRDIAGALFGARRLEREAWKTSSLRDRTIRLVKGGIALMREGYRKLLRGR
jgi:hypothetical protein